MTNKNSVMRRFCLYEYTRDSPSESNPVSILFETLHPFAVPEQLLRELMQTSAAVVLQQAAENSPLLRYAGQQQSRHGRSLGKGLVQDGVVCYSAGPEKGSLLSHYKVLEPVACGAAELTYERFIEDLTGQMWGCYLRLAEHAEQGAGRLPERLFYEGLLADAESAVAEVRKADRHLQKHAAGLSSADVAAEHLRTKLALFVFSSLANHLFLLMHAIALYNEVRNEKAGWVQPLNRIYRGIMGEALPPDLIVKAEHPPCSNPDCNHDFIHLAEIREPVFASSDKPSDKMKQLMEWNIPVLERSRQRIYVKRCDLKRLTERLSLRSVLTA